MRTLEGLSPEWVQIGEAVQNSVKPIRQIARESNLSDTAIRKMMKKHGWERPSSKPATREPRREPAADLPRSRDRATIDDMAKYLETASVKELTGLGRNLVNELMLELLFLNRNHQTLQDMVEDYVSGEKDGRERARLVRALDHDTRTKSMSALATALAKLNDAAPGKKEERQENAEQAASTGRFAAPSAPKFVQ